MDEFITAILASIIEHGSRAVRVFPPASQVLIAFADRIAIEVVCSLPRHHLTIRQDQLIDRSENTLHHYSLEHASFPMKSISELLQRRFVNLGEW